MSAHDPQRGARPWKRVFQVLAGALGVLVALYGLAALLVSLFLDPGTLSRWLEPRLEATLNRDVEIEGARVRLFPSLEAEVFGVQVANLPGYDGPPLADVDRIGLDIDILPLFTGRVRVDEITIEGPRLRLAVDEGGQSNYGDLVPASEGPPSGEEAPISLDIREVLVRGGELSYDNAPDSLTLTVAGLAGEASLSRTDSATWSGSLAVRSDSLHVSHPALPRSDLGLAGPGVSGRATADGGFDWIELAQATLAMEGAELELEGRVANLKEPARRVDLVLRSEGLELSRIVSLLPDSVADAVPGQATGMLGVDLRAQGMIGPDERPSVLGELRLLDVGLVAEDGTVLAEEIGGRVEIRDEVIALRAIEGTLLEGPLEVDGTVVPDTTSTFTVTIGARPHLEGATTLMELADGIHLAGLVAVDVRIEGSVREPHLGRIEGRTVADGVRFEHPRMGVALTVDSADVAWTGDGGSWESVRVGLGEDRLALSGSVQDPLALLAPPGGAVPTVELHATGSRLDLDRVLPPRGDTAVTYGRIVFAHLGDRPLDGRSAGEWADVKELSRPAPAPARGSVRLSLDTLISAPFRAEDLEVTIAFSPALLELSEATLGLFGGSVRATGRMGIGAEAAQPFTLQARGEGIRGEDFLAATSPAGRHVRGTLDFEVDVAGEIDERMLPVPPTVSGTARTEVRDGGLQETPVTRILARSLDLGGLTSPAFARWIASIQIDGPILRFTESTLDTELGPVALGGALGLDGRLDLGVRLQPPASRLDSLALRQGGLLEAAADRLAGSGPVRIGVAVDGTWESPRISPRVELATGDLESSLRSAAAERVEAAGDSVRTRARRAADSLLPGAAGVEDTVRERTEQVRDSAEARLEEERARLEERARQEAEDARRELEERARRLLPG